jgi:hypothetical protein
MGILSYVVIGRQRAGSKQYYPFSTFYSTHPLQGMILLGVKEFINKLESRSLVWLWYHLLQMEWSPSSKDNLDRSHGNEESEKGYVYGMWVLFGSDLMFSNFYWLDLHDKIHVALAILWWNITKIILKIGLPMI